MAKLQEYWVFGYGSLMWRPDFPFAERHHAMIRGYHRRLCVYSHVHRGTPEEPGLVFGLDHGGACHGIAYRVAAGDWPETLERLREREQVTSVYIEATRAVTLTDSGRKVAAMVYLVDRRHRQYAGRHTMEELAVLVRQGRGISGRCVDYVADTLAHLRDMEVHDHRLEALAQVLAAQAAKSSP
jgi:cation transport protein ChaC